MASTRFVLGESHSCRESKLKPLPPFEQVSKRSRLTLKPPTGKRAQEALLISDLIASIFGCEGHCLRFSSEYKKLSLETLVKGPEFVVHRALDSGLREAAVGGLTFARYVIGLNNLVSALSRRVNGRVCQALGAAIMRLVVDARALAAEIDMCARTKADFSIHDMLLMLRDQQSVLAHAHAFGVSLVQRPNEPESENGVESGVEGGVEGGVSDPGGTADEQLQDMQHAQDTLENDSELLDHDPYESEDESSNWYVPRGATVLCLLQDARIHSAGSRVAHRLFSELLELAAKPYLTMIHKWLTQGIIMDPGDEFMICKRAVSPDPHLDEQWDESYTLREEPFPFGLDRNTAESLLTAGKYLNISLQGKHQPELEIHPLTLSNVAAVVADVLGRANGELLRNMREKGLREHLGACRHLFLLMDQDYFPTFLKSAKDLLDTPVSSASEIRLQYVLDMALSQPASLSAQAVLPVSPHLSLNPVLYLDELLGIANVSGISQEQYQEGQLVDQSQIVSKGSYTKVTASRALQLNLEIPFPLSLVISKNSIYRYQFLFRHLTSLKLVENDLADVWLEQLKSTVWRRQSEINTVNDWRRRAESLRANMVAFYICVQFYCVFDVLNKNWVEFMSEFEKIESVVELRNRHVSFLDTCMKECLLTSAGLLRAHAKLLRATSLYTHFLRTHTHTLECVDPSLSSADVVMPILGPNNAEYTNQELLDFLDETMGQYEHSWARYVAEFVRCLNEAAAYDTAAMRSLVGRLSRL